MIDFDKSEVFKLKPIDNDKAHPHINSFLIDGETIFAVFKTVRDQVVFTNKRIVAANVQGLTGSKVDFTSIPYSKIHCFSVETSGTLDLDCEIELYVSEVGKVRFEIKGDFDLVSFNKIISAHVLA
ncbi:PH domain-containing protein [Dasania sp. GY-MA-18]|uniref:PH domain-containing protein n=1 Tax=Dasania phycosphaerae TaxID=2950436 RepID=A0A9J6RIJ7_9GAMM|nr:MULTISPECIES: PH domain-containing protein [Dasania]MCR8922082.1 PH domain-containing protein [Dasania sp. GY-MA-18]MCZ0864510.1 PH domain-containing protein [Dasania phycosphaerae]MCZ0868238.1 PH domain-containing protein [Dasania phycosphaerae]